MIISSLTFFITSYLIFKNRANSHSISHFFLFRRLNVEISTFLFLLISFSFCFLRKFFRLNVLFLCVVAFSMPVCIASSSGFSTCIQSCIVSPLPSSFESSPASCFPALCFYRASSVHAAIKLFPQGLFSVRLS